MPFRMRGNNVTNESFNAVIIKRSHGEMRDRIGRFRDYIEIPSVTQTAGKAG